MNVQPGELDKAVTIGCSIALLRARPLVYLLDHPQGQNCKLKLAQWQQGPELLLVPAAEQSRIGLL